MDSIRNPMDYDSVCHSLHDNHQLHILGCDNQTKRADFPVSYLCFHLNTIEYLDFIELRVNQINY